MATVNRIDSVCGYSKTFKAKNEKMSANNAPQQQVIIVRQTGGVAPAVLSAVVPGLGQLLDGRPKAALGAFSGVIGTAVVSLIGFSAVAAKFKNPAASIAAGIIGVIGFGAAYVANIVNAAKGKQTPININSQY